MKRTLKLLCAVTLLLAATLPARAAIRVGVDTFNCTAGNVSYDEAERISAGLTEMFTTSLANTGAFQVFERSRLAAIAREQRLSMSGMVSEDTLVRIGRLAGVQWIVTGSITECHSEKTASAIPLGNITIGGVDFTSTVVLNLRTINTETGEITNAIRCEGIAKEDSGAIVHESGVALGSIEDKDMLPAAAARAVKTATRELLRRIGGIRGHVIKVESSRAFIDLGSRLGTENGDLYAAYGEGEILRDMRGNIIDAEKKYYALLKVTKVNPGYSICSYVKKKGGPGSIRKGDLLTPIEKGRTARKLVISPRPRPRPAYADYLDEMQAERPAEKNRTQRPSRHVEKTPAASASLFIASPKVNVNTCTDKRLIDAYNRPARDTRTLGLLFRNGSRYYKQKNYRNAYNMFLRSAGETDFDVLNTYWAGMSAKKLGRKNDARKWLKKALKMHPGYEPARKALAGL